MQVVSHSFSLLEGLLPQDLGATMGGVWKGPQPGASLTLVSMGLLDEVTATLWSSSLCEMPIWYREVTLDMKPIPKEILVRKPCCGTHTNYSGRQAGGETVINASTL